MSSIIRLIKTLMHYNTIQHYFKVGTTFFYSKFKRIDYVGGNTYIII